MLIKLLLIGALIPWHANTSSGKAGMFAGVYAGLLAILGALGLAAGGSLGALAVATALRFAAAFGYFWILDRVQGLVEWVFTFAGALALAIFL